jgi:hypothetical protein
LTEEYAFGRLKVVVRRVSLRFVVALLSLSLFAGTALAQEAGQVPATGSQDQGPSNNPIVTLASQFLDHDFFNFFLFANGVYDSQPLTINGLSVNEGGWGFDGGGGAEALKHFRNGYASLSYRGEYRDYESSFYPSGTSQSLAFSVEKALTRRWNVAFNADGGVFLYGGTYFGSAPSQVNNVQTNPFSSESRFLNTGIAVTYRQTRRLSYVLNGQFYLNRYNLHGAIGSTGVTGSGSVLYRTTAKTTLGGTYSHTYFTYQGGSGQSDADTVVGTVSHVFLGHWYASASAGVTHTNSTGFISIPVLFINGNTLTPGFVLGRYNTDRTFPSFEGTLSRPLRRSSLSVSGGQGISSGNGVFLASRNDFLNGYYSYRQSQRANFSLGGGFTHLTSVANNVAFGYSSGSFTAQYSYNVMRHLGVNARYDYVRYGSIGSVGSREDNRFSFGVYFSSQSVPLTLF